MALVALAGVPGAPGATTTALALLLAWPLDRRREEHRRVLLAECDPDGGAVLAGALQGRLDAAWGLRHLAVADRRGLLAGSVWEQLIDLSPGETADRLLLPGVTDPAQTPGLAYTWDPLARLFASWHADRVDVLADLGRSGALGGPSALLRQADAVLLTVRGTLRSLTAAQPRVAALRAELDARGTGADALGLVLVGEGPYQAVDVQRQLGVPVQGVLPWSPRMARVLSDGEGESSDRRFVRSELMRSARSLADGLVAAIEDRRRRLTAPGSGAPPGREAAKAIAAGGPAAPAGRPESEGNRGPETHPVPQTHPPQPRTPGGRAAGSRQPAAGPSAPHWELAPPHAPSPPVPAAYVPASGPSSTGPSGGHGFGTAGSGAGSSASGGRGVDGHAR